MIFLALQTQQTVAIVGTGYSLQTTVSLQDSRFLLDHPVNLNLSFMVRKTTWVFQATAVIGPDGVVHHEFLCEQDPSLDECVRMMHLMQTAECVIVVGVFQKLTAQSLLMAYQYDQSLASANYSVPSYVWIIVAVVVAVFALGVLSYFLKKKQTQLTKELGEIQHRVAEHRSMMEPKAVYF
ncbi:Transmembrane domain-containing protein [Spironucleus salmonicida]|uniref:Transmembrane domain-containing protein n=1 Tax=Spironucleus salmonicida TaxID=348837 RepID=V6LTJ3_9EUKA|nr:Transmembrane domain-containing protein [Spironucleus salmonicida]KAH0571555.1 Transmembrane domain-containing protein [Spironucleus salmonicida]|eukprot:EST47573.1 Transmembrane domain-containing protein [Spironucleus salmonicida]